MQEQSRRQEEMAKEQRRAERQQREYDAEDPDIRQIRNAYWAGRNAQMRIYEAEEAKKAHRVTIQESRGFAESVKYYAGYFIGLAWRTTWFTIKIIFCIILFVILWNVVSAIMGIH
jgi:hypothetical protein